MPKDRIIKILLVLPVTLIPNAYGMVALAQSFSLIAVAARFILV